MPIANSTLYLSLVALGALGALADGALNKWAQSGRHEWLALSCGVWLAVNTMFGLVLRTERMSFGSAVVSALVAHSVAAILLDQFYFVTRLSKWEWTGIVCAVASVALIELGRLSALQPE